MEMKTERRGVAKQGQHRLTHGDVAVQEAYFIEVYCEMPGLVTGFDLT